MCPQTKWPCLAMALSHPCQSRARPPIGWPQSTDHQSPQNPDTPGPKVRLPPSLGTHTDPLPANKVSRQTDDHALGLGALPSAFGVFVIDEIVLLQR